MKMYLRQLTREMLILITPTVVHNFIDTISQTEDHKIDSFIIFPLYLYIIYDQSHGIPCQYKWQV